MINSLNPPHDMLYNEVWWEIWTRALNIWSHDKTTKLFVIYLELFHNGQHNTIFDVVRFSKKSLKCPHRNFRKFITRLFLCAADN